MLTLEQMKRIEEMDKNTLEKVVFLLKAKEATLLIGKGRQEQVNYVIIKMIDDLIEEEQNKEHPYRQLVDEE